jgi:hypothetical protein
MAPRRVSRIEKRQTRDTRGAVEDHRRRVRCPGCPNRRVQHASPDRTGLQIAPNSPPSTTILTPAPTTDQQFREGHRRGRSPAMMQAWSQHGVQVGHSVLSRSPSGPRGWVAPQRQRMGAPSGTLRSRRSMACLRPRSGNQTNEWGSGYGVGTIVASRILVSLRWCPASWQPVHRQGCRSQDVQAQSCSADQPHLSTRASRVQVARFA